MASDTAEEEADCPLCCNPLDATDRHFRPCACGYQICAWCWHQLMERAAAEDGKAKCPACRTPYDESAIRKLDAPPPEELQREASAKRKGSGSGGSGSSSASASASAPLLAPQQPANDRKHLVNVRVVQRNLVYVVGLTAPYCREETLRRHHLLTRYGKIKLQTSLPKPADIAAAGRSGAGRAENLTGARTSPTRARRTPRGASAA